ncbi:hypothetical protein HPB52_004864 [Rhipicephalus sanguineus]|uniref:Uncharacterized protein n=1 Tax=Rhipicephalus sanguineus TaxID=34632 RepID=A0A9D4PUC8_RHISA|nr:hypothetical protein HPB52_004864 [Rhipicephalus sanguineus]
MKKFETILGIDISVALFGPCEEVAKEAAEALGEAISRLRSEKELAELWQQTQSTATQIGLKEPQVTRPTKRFEFTQKPSEPAALDPKTAMRKEFFAATDRITSEIHRQFKQPGMDTLVNLELTLTNAARGQEYTPYEDRAAGAGRMRPLTPAALASAIIKARPAWRRGCAVRHRFFDSRTRCLCEEAPKCGAAEKSFFCSGEACARVFRRQTSSFADLDFQWTFSVSVFRMTDFSDAIPSSPSCRMTMRAWTGAHWRSAEKQGGVHSSNQMPGTYGGSKND